MTIRIARTETEIEVSVHDNGVGIKPERLRQILDPAVLPQRIGLRNTDRRLRQLHGEGLRIQSSPEQGTTVAFGIPTKNKE